MKMTIDPFMSVSRVYSLNRDTLMLRCSFSYLHDSDWKIETLAPSPENSASPKLPNEENFLKKSIKKLVKG